MLLHGTLLFLDDIYILDLNIFVMTVDIVIFGCYILFILKKLACNVERGSSVGIRSGSTEFSELWIGRLRKLCLNSVNSDREPTLGFLWCIRILACRDTHDITSEWVIYQS
jgi:hypothetical protein